MGLIWSTQRHIRNLRRKVNGNIVSRKGENHGIGLDNVKRIVDKYDGTMVIECDNGRYDIDVIMFVG